VLLDPRPSFVLFSSLFDPSVFTRCPSGCAQARLCTNCLSSLDIQLHQVGLTLAQYEQLAFLDTRSSPSSTRPARWIQVMQHERPRSNSFGRATPGGFAKDIALVASAFSTTPFGGAVAAKKKRLTGRKCKHVLPAQSTYQLVTKAISCPLEPLSQAAQKLKTRGGDQSSTRISEPPPTSSGSPDPERSPQTEAVCLIPRTTSSQLPPPSQHTNGSTKYIKTIRESGSKNQ